MQFLANSIPNGKTAGGKSVPAPAAVTVLAAVATKSPPTAAFIVASTQKRARHSLAKYTGGDITRRGRPGRRNLGDPGRGRQHRRPSKPLPAEKIVCPSGGATSNANLTAGAARRQHCRRPPSGGIDAFVYKAPTDKWFSSVSANTVTYIGTGRNRQGGRRLTVGQRRHGLLSAGFDHRHFCGARSAACRCQQTLFLPLLLPLDTRRPESNETQQYGGAERGFDRRGIGDRHPRAPACWNALGPARAGTHRIEPVGGPDHNKDHAQGGRQASSFKVQGTAGAHTRPSPSTRVKPSIHWWSRSTLQLGAVSARPAVELLPAAAAI